MSFSLRGLWKEAVQPETLRAVPFILMGCLVTAVGLVYFINPYGIVPGGVFGLSIVLHAIFPSAPIGTIALCIQIPLLILSLLVLGGKLGLRTLVAAVTLPLMVNALTQLSYPVEALKNLDPTKLLGGHLDLTNDLIISSLIGGVLVGIGTGIVIKQSASSGGSDIIAMIIHKFTRVRFSYALMTVDGSIVLSGLLVIGMGFGLSIGNAEPKSWMLSFYSLIAMFAITRSIATVVSGTHDTKLVQSICDSNDRAELREWILHSLDRTATCTPSKGLYSGSDKDILLLVVRQKELPAITEGIKLRAPNCFVIVTDAYDTYGFRWKELPDAGTMRLE